VHNFHENLTTCKSLSRVLQQFDIDGEIGGKKQKMTLASGTVYQERGDTNSVG
jgi:hypothetical protein